MRRGENERRRVKSERTHLPAGTNVTDLRCGIQWQLPSSYELLIVAGAHPREQATPSLSSQIARNGSCLRNTSVNHRPAGASAFIRRQPANNNRAVRCISQFGPRFGPRNVPRSVAAESNRDDLDFGRNTSTER